MKEERISAHKDPTTGLCLATIQENRQALVFCNSKRAAESQAEKVALARQDAAQEIYEALAQEALGALSSPTKQCKRLALCLRKGVAFHHAGLATKQRELIEDAFREGKLAVICSTPTLAAGLDLPAYRAVIRDTKRFTERGMRPIPVLEYLQMAGRAGRPGKETSGQAILVASKEQEMNDLTQHYIYGEAEDIYSKLAVEPVLRTFVLSLVATEVITTLDELNHFFDQTFYAYQFRNNRQIHQTLKRVVKMLQEWAFLDVGTGQDQIPVATQAKTPDLFMTAAQVFKNESIDETQPLTASFLGKRVSEMYLDPLTAHMLLEGLQRLTERVQEGVDETIQRYDHEQTVQIIHLLNCALEMRPLLRSRVADDEAIHAMRQEHSWLISEDDFYAYTTDDFTDTLQTTRCFEAWVEEHEEDDLLDQFNIRPGEVSAKLQKLDWLCYACEELARAQKMNSIIRIIKHVRMRLKHGVKAELLPLLAFKGIGRVRARKLFAAGITGVKDVKTATTQKLELIIGPALARQLKEQVGEDGDSTTQVKLS